MVLFFLIYGLIGAFAELLQFYGIVTEIPVATVVFLLYTQPIWTCILGRVTLKESISLRRILVIAAGIYGALILSQAEINRGGSLQGIMSAILGGFFVALWVVWGKISGINNQHHITTAVGWSGFTAIWLVVLRPIFSIVAKNNAMLHLSWDFPVKYWLWLGAFALVAGVMPGLLLFSGLQSVSASTAGVLLLLEPVAASIMSSMLFHQQIGLRGAIGGLLIFIANLFLPADTYLPPPAR